MSDIDHTQALEGLKAGRKAAIEICACFGQHAGESREATHLLKKIDEMAELLTGDPDYFRDPHHSTP